MAKTFFLGLTGGIASGKSTIANFFIEKGIPIIDGDKVARGVQEKGSPALREIEASFGKEFLLENGELNRKKLGELIFSSKSQREKLDKLMNPFLRQAFEKEKSFLNGTAPLVVLDIPLLFEKDYRSEVDAVMLAYIHPSEQLKRLMIRDGLSEEEAIQRISSQMEMEEKRKRSDFVIDNNGTKESLQEQLEEFFQKMMEEKDALSKLR
ncbi:MAG: dephospho-CoA kinase [Streptococcaceae bacterium]|jgi:dephospho-CoA kinase|nr:dephospho-CoA kinase [Streptococcaceae bacterium]